jgi:hypothetical protein
VSEKIRETEPEADPDAKAERPAWTTPTLRRIEALNAQLKSLPGVELHHHLTS